jgi:hypothetical protein
MKPWSSVCYMRKIISICLKEFATDRHKIQFRNPLKARNVYTRAYEYVVGRRGSVRKRGGGGFGTKSSSPEHWFILETRCFDSAGMLLVCVRTLEAAWSSQFCWCVLYGIVPTDIVTDSFVWWFDRCLTSFFDIMASARSILCWTITAYYKTSAYFSVYILLWCNHLHPNPTVVLLYST